MGDRLKPAAEGAKEMPKPAKGASDEYLAARRDLLAAEIDLRRQMTAVAQQRQALPAGPAAQDYTFEGSTGPVQLSELFDDDHHSVVVYCYMFPRYKTDDRPAATSGDIADLPREEQPCPSCTNLLDQLNAAMPGFEAGGGRLVVVGGTSPSRLEAIAKDRGWRNLRLLSSAGTSFKRDYYAEDEDGQQEPMMLVFKRDGDGTIRLFWASDLVWADPDPGQDHRAMGTLETFWNLLDLTPEGRPQDFHEQMQYECCRPTKDGKC